MVFELNDKFCEKGRQEIVLEMRALSGAERERGCMIVTS